MWNHLFKHVDIRKENVHILDGNAEDLDEECRKFEAEIAKLGGIELFLGGNKSTMRSQGCYYANAQVIIQVLDLTGTLRLMSLARLSRHGHVSRHSRTRRLSLMRGSLEEISPVYPSSR